MLEQLFGSKTRFKLLRLFFRDPDRSFYVRELSRAIDSQINAVRRELSLFLKTGIVRVNKEVVKDEEDTLQGSSLRKYFVLDKSSLLYPELHSLLLKAQVLGEQEFVEKVNKGCGSIKLFLLTGKFTGVEDAATDILLVGKLKPRSVSSLVNKYEKELGFEIRYTLMSEKEFRERRNVMDKFLYSVFETGHHKIVNKLKI